MVVPKTTVFTEIAVMAWYLSLGLLVLAKVGVMDGIGNFFTQPLVLVVCNKEPEYKAIQNRVPESRVDLFMA